MNFREGVIDSFVILISILLQMDLKNQQFRSTIPRSLCHCFGIVSLFVLSAINKYVIITFLWYIFIAINVVPTYAMS